jgi:hypothetical protein
MSYVGPYGPYDRIYSIGVDPSLRSTGIAVVERLARPDAKPKLVYLNELKGGVNALDDHMLNQAQVLDELCQKYSTIDGALTVGTIELPFVGINPRQAIRLAIGHGSARLSLLRYCIGGTRVVEPRKWREPFGWNVLRSADAKLAAVSHVRSLIQRDGTKKRHGELDWIDENRLFLCGEDEAEAACIALFRLAEIDQAVADVREKKRS